MTAPSADALREALNEIYNATVLNASPQLFREAMSAIRETARAALALAPAQQTVVAWRWRYPIHSAPGTWGDWCEPTHNQAKAEAAQSHGAEVQALVAQSATVETVAPIGFAHPDDFGGPCIAVYAEPHPTFVPVYTAPQPKPAEQADERALTEAIVKAARKWYGTGWGKDEAAHELAMAVMHLNKHSAALTKEQTT